VRQGLHQGDGGLVRLFAIAGMAVALDLTLTGREVLADEALRLGLVNRVVPGDQVMATAEAYARMILGNSQSAIRSAKETLQDIVGRSLDDALRLENTNAYAADFNDVRVRLERFFNKAKP
jgi:enoyl-CoA hydratase